MAERQTTGVVATPDTQKSVKDMKKLIRGYFPEAKRKLFVIVFTVALLLRVLRVALAGFMEKRQYDSDFHDMEPFFTPAWFQATYTLVGAIGFAEVMCAYYHYRFYTKVTYYVGYSVVCAAWLIDLVCLAWAGKTIDKGAIAPSHDVDGATVALCTFNIVQSVFELAVLVVHFRTYPTEDLAFDHGMSGLRLGAHALFDIANFLCRAIRVGLAASVLNRATKGDVDLLTHINSASLALVTFTVVSGLGFAANVSGFNYCFKSSRPNFYLHCGWLLWSFALDVICMGFAARQYSDGGPGGVDLDQATQGCAAFTFIQIAVSVVHMGLVSYWEPDRANPRPKLKDAKIVGGVLKPFLVFAAFDVVLRIIRLALAADLFNKFFDGNPPTGADITVTVEVMMFALFSASGFSTAWTGFFYAFYFSQAAFFVYLCFLSMTWWFDVTGALFALGQYSAVKNNEVDTQAQVLGAGAILQTLVLAILFLVVFCNKPPTDEMSDEQRKGSVISEVDPRVNKEVKK